MWTVVEHMISTQGKNEASVIVPIIAIVECMMKVSPLTHPLHGIICSNRRIKTLNNPTEIMKFFIRLLPAIISRSSHRISTTGTPRPRQADDLIIVWISIIMVIIPPLAIAIEVVAIIMKVELVLIEMPGVITIVVIDRTKEEARGRREVIVIIIVGSGVTGIEVTVRETEIAVTEIAEAAAIGTETGTIEAIKPGTEDGVAAVAMTLITETVVEAAATEVTPTVDLAAVETTAAVEKPETEDEVLIIIAAAATTMATTNHAVPEETETEEIDMAAIIIPRRIWITHLLLGADPTEIRPLPPANKRSFLQMVAAVASNGTVLAEEEGGLVVVEGRIPRVARLGIREKLYCNFLWLCIYLDFDNKCLWKSMEAQIKRGVQRQL